MSCSFSYAHILLPSLQPIAAGLVIVKRTTTTATAQRYVQLNCKTQKHLFILKTYAYTFLTL
jgi:hypothetical protein